MKNQIVKASLIAAASGSCLFNSAMADRIIQQPTGVFVIVSEKEAQAVFSQNKSTFLTAPPTQTIQQNRQPTVTKKKRKSAHTVAEKSKPKKQPTGKKLKKPVTTVESADSIYLRLMENKPK